jgi:flagellar hook assembly protein FlgD
VIPVTLYVVSVGTEEDPPVLYTKLGGNYPNPFNPTTKISYSVKEPGHVTLEIFNIKGEKIKTLIDSELPADRYTIEWNGTDIYSKPVSSGIYFYKMKCSNYSSTKKMILLK